MAVRMFGGWEFTEQDLNSRMPAVVGYKKGTPMGGNLRVMPEGAKAPNFMVYALRDPNHTRTTRSGPSPASPVVLLRLIGHRQSICLHLLK